MIENSGHMVTLEQPTVVAAMLIGWMRDRQSDIERAQVLELDC